MRTFLFLQHPSTRAIPATPEFAGVPSAVLIYVALNVFSVFKFDKIDSENLHHIIDGLLALRVCTYTLGLQNVTGNINYCLDYLSECLPDIDGIDKYKYQKSKEYQAEFINNDLINDIAGLLKIEKAPKLVICDNSLKNYYLDTKDFNRERLLECGCFRDFCINETSEQKNENFEKIPEYIQKLILKVR